MKGQFSNGLPSPYFKKILQWRARKQPNKKAYIFLANGETAESSLTYAELDRRVRAVAVSLQNHQAQGERALLMYPTGLEFIVAFFGCLYADVIPVTTSPPRRHKLSDKNLQRVQAIAQEATPGFILAPQKIISGLNNLLSDLPELEMATWLAHRELEGEPPADYYDNDDEPRDIAFLQYTSGSTHHPKGVIVTHAALQEQLAYYQQRAGATWQETIMVGWLPHFHDYGLVGFILSAAYMGVPYYFMSPTAFIEQPMRWLKAISTFRATYTGGPSFAFDYCVKKIDPADCAAINLDSLQIISVSAEPINAQVLQKFSAVFQPFGFDPQMFLPCYGLAEAVLCVSSQPGLVTQTFCEQALRENHVEQIDTEGRVLVSCGHTLDGQELVIVDPETRCETADSEVGEIWVSGKSIAKGYWKRPFTTRQTFAARRADNRVGSYLRTGDLGFIHEGHLFLTGRLKDMIIVRGQNHAPQDIETTAQEVDTAVRDHGGAAFLIQAANQEHLVLVQELDRHYRADPLPLCIAIRAAIAKNHGLNLAIIELIIPFSLPKTTSGKIQRHQCRTAFQNRRLKSVFRHLFEESKQAHDSLLPSSLSTHALEAQLIALTCEILSLKQISAQDNFFNLGADSLAAYNLIFKIQESYNIDLPPHLLFDLPTISHVAVYIQAQLNAQTTSLYSV